MANRLQSAVTFRNLTIKSYISEVIATQIAEDLVAKRRYEKIDAAQASTPPPVVPQNHHPTAGRCSLSLADIYESRQLRISENLSDDELAKRFGVSASTVRRSLRRTFRPSQIQAIRSDFAPNKSNQRIADELNAMRADCIALPKRDRWSPTRMPARPPGADRRNGFLFVHEQR